MIATPTEEAVAQLANQHVSLFCHSGLDPESSTFFLSVAFLDAGSSPA